MSLAFGVGSGLLCWIVIELQIEEDYFVMLEMLIESHIVVIS